MRMRIDESGHQRHPRQLDHLRTGGDFDFAGAAHSLDFCAAYQHYPIVVQLRRVTVEDAGRLEDEKGFWFCSRRLSLREREAQD